MLFLQEVTTRRQKRLTDWLTGQKVLVQFLRESGCKPIWHMQLRSQHPSRTTPPEQSSPIRRVEWTDGAGETGIEYDEGIVLDDKFLYAEILYGDVEVVRDK